MPARSAVANAPYRGVNMQTQWLLFANSVYPGDGRGKEISGFRDAAQA
jgi:hypothetical protein